MKIWLEVELERTSGKFVGTEEAGEELAQLVDVGSLYIDESEYEITDVTALSNDEVKRIFAPKWRKGTQHTTANPLPVPPIQISGEGSTVA